MIFIIMHHRRIHAFKSLRRWLDQNPEIVRMLRWTSPPHRATVSVRYKSQYEPVHRFILRNSMYVPDMDVRFRHSHLVEDKSLFRARGTLWHQKHLTQGCIPDGLLGLDTDAAWAKSSYHGWVYGYAVHLTCNQQAFPIMICVDTASVSESNVLNDKEELIMNELCPKTLTADDAVAKAIRIRRWAARGTVFLTPTLRWVKW